MGQQAACQEKGLCGCFAQEDNPDPLAQTLPANPNKNIPYTQGAPAEASSAGPQIFGGAPGGASMHWDDPVAPALAPAPTSSARGPYSPSSSAAHVPTGPSKSVSFDFILSDLEAAEQAAYGEAFSAVARGRGTCALDNTSMRDFIMKNSIIGPDDLDPHLLQVADETMTSITQDGFLHVLRENAVSDTSTIEQFLGMSQNGETVAAEECRSGLLMFSQRNMGANFTEEKWDRIFNTVMWDADVTVSLEKWIGYCKFVARIVRLSIYCGLS